MENNKGPETTRNISPGRDDDVNSNNPDAGRNAPEDYTDNISNPPVGYSINDRQNDSSDSEFSVIGTDLVGQIPTEQHYHGPTTWTSKYCFDTKRACAILKVITVEPVILMYFIVLAATGPMVQQLIYKRVAWRMNFTIPHPDLNNNTECLANKSDPNFILEQEVQQSSSNYMVIVTVAGCLPQFVTAALMGAYGDKTGRKPGIVLPLVGFIIYMVLNIIILFCNLPLPLIIIGSFIDGLLGGIGTLMMSCFAYIADITTREQRVLRIVAVEMSIAIGMTVSQISSGYLITFLGFAYSFVIVLIVLTLALIYTVFYLRETIEEKQPDARFFSVKHLKSVAVLYIRDDGSNRVWKLRLMLVIIALSCMVEFSGNTIILFLMNSPLCWTSVKIGYFLGISCIIRNSGSIGAAKILQHKLPDSALVCIACCSGVLYNVFLSLANTDLLVFLAPFGGVISLLVVPMGRALVSKLAQPHEQGLLFSSLSWAQLLSVMLGNLTFNAIYSNTLTLMHGFIFVVMAFFFLTDAVLSGCLVYGIWREKKSGTDTRSISINADDDDDELLLP